MTPLIRALMTSPPSPTTARAAVPSCGGADAPRTR